MKGIAYLADLDLDGNYNIKIFLREVGREIVDLFNLAQYLRAGEWLFLKGYWILGFCKMREISCLAEELLASQEIICSMELFKQRRNLALRYIIKCDSINDTLIL